MAHCCSIRKYKSVPVTFIRWRGIEISITILQHCFLTMCHCSKKFNQWILTAKYMYKMHVVKAVANCKYAAVVESWLSCGTLSRM